MIRLITVVLEVKKEESQTFTFHTMIRLITSDELYDKLEKMSDLHFIQWLD